MGNAFGVELRLRHQCAGQTGKVLWMKEPHDEGVANRIGPESCIAAREGKGEALTGVRAGQPWSRENQF